jgi:hypothetical protein
MIDPKTFRLELDKLDCIDKFGHVSLPITKLNIALERSTVDAVPVVRCKDCKHRPTKPGKYADGFDLAFPDEACPCYCGDDPFYSWYPSDDWFCPKGERKGGDE